MNETTILWSSGAFTLTAWSLILALSAAAAVILTAVLGRERAGVNTTLSACIAAILGAVIGGRAVYCLTMLEFILYDLGGAGFIPQIWQGGFTLWGAVIGGACGVWVYAKAARRDACSLLNLMAPGAALVISAARFAEYFTGQGLGDYIVDEALMRFPFAVESFYGDWQMPVFLYEGVAAAVILIVALVMLLKGGRSAEVFAVLLALSQIILESWREDEFIRFGFVRFNQLGAALVLGAVLALRMVREVKAHGWQKWQTVRIILFALGIGVIITIEFALDKSTIDNGLLYAVMAATLPMMGFALLRGPKAAD